MNSDKINASNEVKVIKVKRSTLNQEGPGYKIFSVFNILFLLGVLVITIYPVWFVLIASFSNPIALMEDYGLMLLPRFPLTFEAYELVFRHPQLISGFRNTFYILSVGLVFNMILTALGAYFMSLRNCMFRKPISVIIIFTMYFNAGIVPTFLNVQWLGLLDSLWSVILINSISTFNLLILRSAFMGIPESLTESATIDGAGHFRTLTQIFLPLTKSTLAVMLLFYAVGHWNAWFFASVFIRRPDMLPLQVVLRQLLLLGVNVDAFAALGDMGAAMIAELMQYAFIIVSTLPILILYPNLQRFFTKGVMIGAIKG